MISAPRSPAALAAATLLGFALLAAGIGERGLMETSEGRYGSMAAEMARTGDVVVPRLNGVKRFEKPPLALWAMAGSVAILGESELALRLPGAVAATLALLVAYAMAGGGKATDAPWAPLLLLASPLHFSLAKVLTTDVYLALFSALGLLGVLRALDEPERAGVHLSLAALATGLGFLTKGPVALVLVLLPALLEALSSRAWGDVRRLLSPLRLLLFTLVAAPWFVAVTWRQPGLLAWFVEERTVKVLASSRGFHAGPLFYYLPLLLVGLLPGIALLLGAGPRRLRELWSSRRHRLLILAVAAPLALFTASASKLATYVMPLALPASVLAAGVVGASEARRGVVAAAAALGLLGAAGLATRGWLVTPFGDALPGDAVQTLTVAYLLLLAGGGAAAALLARRGAKPACLLLCVVQVAALLLVTRAVAVAGGPLNSGREIAMEAARLAGPDTPIICYRSFLRSLPFYAGRHVTLSNWYAKERLDDAEWEAVGADARVNLAALASGDVVVVTERQWAPEALRLVGGLRVVMTRGELVLLARSSRP